MQYTYSFLILDLDSANLNIKYYQTEQANGNLPSTLGHMTYSHANAVNYYTFTHAVNVSASEYRY